MLAFLLISSVLITSTVGHPGCTGPADASYVHNEGSGDFCITLEADQYKRDEGENKCQSYDNGRVIKIGSAQLSNFVIEKMNGHAKAFPLWINARYYNDAWKYDGGTSSLDGYTNWDGGQEPNGTVGACGVMYANEKWGGTFCDSSSTLVCQYSMRKCEGKGWVMNPTKDACIKPIKKQRLNFEKALAHCQEVGGKLATTMTLQSQRSQVRKLVKFRGHFWIGIRDLAGYGTFTDFEGNTLTSTAFKNPGPFSTVRQCATWKRGWWYPKKCTKRLFFICEKEVTLGP